ncbi:MAG: hypothetical protein ACPH9L_05910 [Flavobacteriaceae bacterium]
MGILSIFKKKSNYDNYAYEKKILSVLSFGPFTNIFSEYSELQSEQNMKIWDALFPVAICGFSSLIDKIIDNPTEFNSLKKSMSKQVIQGNELLDDYAIFIKSQNLSSNDLSHYTAFWLSKNLQLYLPENLKSKVEELKFLNIVSLFLKLSFNNENANFRNYLETTFKSDLKAKSGMNEYVTLIELYCKNIFELIKEKV